MTRRTSSAPSSVPGDYPGRDASERRGEKRLRPRTAKRAVRQPVAWSDHLSPTEPIELTPEEFAGRHLAELEAERPPSLNDWRTFYSQWLQDFGGVPLRQHTTDMWVGWLKARRAERPPPAEKTLEKAVGLAGAAYGRARELRAIDDNPLRHLPRNVRPSRRPRNPLKSAQSVLSVGEMRLVFGDDGFRGDFFDHLFFTAALCLGGRVGEVTEATYLDYRPDLRPLPGVLLERQWHEKLREVRPTKDGVPKAVPIHPRLSRLLDVAPTYFAQRAGRAVHPTDRLFPFFPRIGVPEPRRWVQKTALRRWREFLADLGIPDPPSGPRTFHATRHTFVSRLYAAKAPELAVRALTHPSSLESMAHGDAHMTYVHVEWPALCDAIASLDFDSEPIALPRAQLTFCF